MKSRDIIFVIFSYLALALLFIWLEPFGPQLQDRYAFWAAANSFLNQSSPYDYEKVLALAYSQDPYRVSRPLELVWAPPFIFSLIWWFGLFSFKNFLIVHQVITIIIATLSIYIFCKWQRGAHNFILLSLITLSFAPLYIILIFGPINVICFFGLALFFLLRNTDRKYGKILSGIALSLTTIKPHLLSLLYLIVILDFIRFKQKDTLLGLLAGFSLLTLPTIVFFPDLWHHYFTATKGFPINYFTPTIASWIVRSFHLPSFLRFAPVAIGSLIMIYFCFKKISAFKESHYLISIIFSLILAPYLWVYDFILFYPIFLYLLFKLAKINRYQRSFNYLVFVPLANVILWFCIFPSQYAVWYPTIILLIFVSILSTKNLSRT